MKRFIHTPPRLCRTLAAGALISVSAPLPAQTSAVPPLLDALSITVQRDTAMVARGSMRFRQVRTTADLEFLITGTIVRRGQRVYAELHTDSTFALRRYLAETRDSAGHLLDRVQVTSAGGRVTLERVSPLRRMVREYVAQRDLMVLDSATVVPFVALAGLNTRTTGVALLDVRRGTLTPSQLSAGEPVELTVAEVVVPGTPVVVSGAIAPLSWWRDARGRLLRVVWDTRNRVLRDDPPT